MSNESMDCADSGDMKIFAWFPGNSILKFLVEFWNCVVTSICVGGFEYKFSKLLISLFRTFCLTYYRLLDFDRTYAILTHVKYYNLVPGSRRQDLAPMECISKCSKFIRESYVKFSKLPDAAHLRFCPRKSFKMIFWYRGPMESWIFCYHSKGFYKLYKLSY